MNWMVPDPAEVRVLRADPLLVEQELDVRPEFAEEVERRTGIRSGRVFWRSSHDHLYALELGDLGRGRPSTATVFGFWDRFEPRPPEHEIDADLMDFNRWLAGDAAPVVDKVAAHSGIRCTWPPGSVYRTPDSAFADVPDFPYEPHYIEIEGLRMAWVEAGSGDPILCLHGEPTWSFLYRRMIPELSRAGRVICPDLIGFGRSDKPLAANAFTYRSHVRWVRRFIAALGLERITLVCQDWGGLLGLRVLSEMPERFSRLVAMNTGIPNGGPPAPAFLKWRQFAASQRSLDLARLMKGSVRTRRITDEEAAAYQAPFPNVESQMAARVFPRLVPIRRDHPGAHENRLAIERLRTLVDLPVLLPWADSDPITASGEAQLRSIFRKCADPLPVRGAGHFIQEDAGEEVAAHIRRWLE
jgi:haloalkane dehalogenase